MSKIKYFQTSCCVLAITMLVAFIIHYMIPPLADFQGHVALGMINSTFLSHYYQYQFSIVYHLFDSIVRFWTFFLGNQYQYVSLASYLTLIFFIFSTVYTFIILQNTSKKQAFYIIAILAGPIFLLLHCGGFIWGVIPYNLAVFMSCGSSLCLWAIYQEILATKTCSLKIASLFGLYTFLAIYSHAVGFLYLGIAWIIPIVYIISAKSLGKKRFLFIIVLITILLFLSLFIKLPFSHFSDWSKEIVIRLHWIISGKPYNSSNLIPQAQEGWFDHKFFRIALAMIPYAVIALLILFRKTRNHWWAFVTLQLALQLVLEVLIVDSFGNDKGNLRYLYSRNWLFVDAWTFIGIAYLVTQIQKNAFKYCCYLSPILTLFCLYAVMPLYANFRAVPIEKRADHYTKLLIKEVHLYRENHPKIAQKTVMVTYKHHTIDSDWFLYHLIPTLMINSPELAKQNIVIQSHWCELYFAPLKCYYPDSKKVVYLRWKQETKERIELENDF